MLQLHALEICPRNGFEYYGTRLPKGSIIGEDTNGAFYCVNYRVKNYNNNDRPVLEIYRMTAEMEWRKKVEGNATTEAILDMYYEHEDECIIDMGQLVQDLQALRDAGQYHVKSLRIVKAHGFKYYGRELPKGAIYGQDEHGLFVCVDYRVKGRTGYYKGYPRLVIYRPASSSPFYAIQKNGRDSWVANVEANNTTLAILNKYEHNEILCNIDYSLQAKQVAKKQDIRLGFTDSIYCTGSRGFKPQMKAKTTLEFVIGSHPLEQCNGHTYYIGMD